jgi:hypothetical protein
VINAMPRPRPPHLIRETTRHGKSVWYVRATIGTRRRVRIRGEYGTPEFWSQYHAVIAGELRPEKLNSAHGTVAWLIERYRETTAWTDLSLATRRNRENHFKAVIKTAGHRPARAITQLHLIEARDRRAATPAQARNFLDAMRGLFKWAKAAKHVATIRPRVLPVPSARRGRASSNGPRPTPRPTTNAGRSAQENGSGAMFCSTPACGAVMPSGSGVNMCATGLRACAQRKVKAR